MPKTQPKQPTQSQLLTQSLPPADRYLARHVWRDGRDYGLATVSIRDGKPVVEPFICETPRTAFVDGDIVITGNRILLV